MDGKQLVSACQLYSKLFAKLFIRIMFKYINKMAVTSWTGYMMVLIAPGIYIMFEVGQAELPRSFRTCGQFIDSVDNLFMFAVCLNLNFFFWFDLFLKLTNSIY